MKRYWIQKAIKPNRKGALSRQLGIPIDENIPMTLLRKIKNTSIGNTIVNPTKTGKKHITVTPLLKKRAVLAYNLKKIKKR